MPKNILNIVNSAYRGTLEEQDDTIVWLSRAMRGAGAPIDILLKGTATNYAVTGQDASGLTFGDWTQKNPPDVARDLTAFLGKGGKVLVVQEDLAERGIDPKSIVAGFTPIDRGALPALFAQYDAVWSW
jgi:hypothetical protein